MCPPSTAGQSGVETHKLLSPEFQDTSAIIISPLRVFKQALSVIKINCLLGKNPLFCVGQATKILIKLYFLGSSVT